MRRGIKCNVLAISILLALSLVGSLSIPSNAQVVIGAHAKRVMFRDDDVSPSASRVLKEVNQVHIDEGVPVTRGIVPAWSFHRHDPLFIRNAKPADSTDLLFLI
jgi:hypothetical protein